VVPQYVRYYDERYKLLPAFDTSGTGIPARAIPRRDRVLPGQGALWTAAISLKTTGTMIAATAVAQQLPAAALPPKRPAAKGRVVLPINRRWRYSPKATPAAHERNFDDSAFARVTVPHTNIRLPWHSFDEKTYEFVSIYRRQVPPASRRARPPRLCRL
jgi:hypothetical protein